MGKVLYVRYLIHFLLSTERRVPLPIWGLRLRGVVLQRGSKSDDDDSLQRRPSDFGGDPAPDLNSRIIYIIPAEKKQQQNCQLHS